ncbi:hypothetical protein Q7P37_003402 [Cladosporium fusiforme]
MPRLPISEQALRLALTQPTLSAQSQFVCRACIRQYHPTPAFRAELPFWKRMQQSIFGSPEKKAASEKRDEAHQKLLQEIADQGGAEKQQPYFDDQGREWQIAAVVDPSINEKYVQAQRWDGLEWVGSKEWVALSKDAGEAYVGFNPRRKLDFSAAEWRRVVHHVAVEVLALAQAERDVNAVYTERDVNVEDWMRSARVQIKEVDGAIELQFPTEESRDAILKAVPQSLAEEIAKAAEDAEGAQAAAAEAAKDLGASANDAEASAEIAEEAMEEGELEVGQHKVDTKELDAQEKSTMRLVKAAVRKSLTTVDSQWLQTPLADPVMKLAVNAQAHHSAYWLPPPDPAISSVTSLSDLYLAYKRKPEPKKLRDSKQLHKVNLDFPNVVVHKARQSPIHKDIQVGRWKLIEEELLARDLPVTGSRYQNAKTTSPTH